VFVGGDPGSWDWTIRAGWPLLDGDTLRMWYAGTTSDFPRWSIGYATAPFVFSSEPDSAPAHVALHSNVPNPFRATTALDYDLPRAGFVTLDIFDMLGREVATLVREERGPGRYRAVWDGSSQRSGVYLCRLVAGGRAETRRLILMK